MGFVWDDTCPPIPPAGQKPPLTCTLTLQPQRDSNPCRHLERVVSSATRRWGHDRRSRLLRVARGGGLEPPTTGPEPAVLPITPPPNGPDQPSASPRTQARDFTTFSIRAWRRKPITRPTATATVSRTMYRASVMPLIGLVVVGDEWPSSPSSDAMARMRSEWNGSETRRTSLIPRSSRKLAAAARDCHDVVPDTSRRTSSS